MIAYTSQLASALQRLHQKRYCVFTFRDFCRQLQDMTRVATLQPEMGGIVPRNRGPLLQELMG